MAVAFNLDEPRRLQRLRTLGILDTPRESHFDALTRLAAHVMRVPVAMMNLIDEAREWCKSAWGAERHCVSRRESLCAHALATNDSLLIPDARIDEAFRDHPAVTGERRVVFYFGIVLKTSDGLALGTLCVVDHEPRSVSESDRIALFTLAEQIVSMLEKDEVARQLGGAETKLAAAERNRDQFLAMLAHELRAPLAPIHTAIQVLDQPETTGAQRAWAHRVVRRHVRYMSEIVDHLLSASLVSFGAVDLTLAPMNLPDLLDRACELAERAIERGGHMLTRQGDANVNVQADATQCPLIIANLLNNAAAYTPPGGQIDIVVTTRAETVEINVRDSGVGIAASDIDEIFEVFGQTKQPLSRSKGGMGLGLTLARRLAKWHGGELTAHSGGIGQGSEFTLTLRRADPAPPAAPAATVAGSGVEARTVPERLLIVEDNRDSADALTLYFELAGHETRVAYCAADALALAAAWRPDVVLSDLGLPGMDGFALVRSLRALDAMRDALFIAISGYATDADREKALAAGFDAHFAKPVDANRLEQQLSALRLAKFPGGTPTA